MCMKTFVLSIAVLLISAPITFARVIGSDYGDDIVAVYHFNVDTFSDGNIKFIYDAGLENIISIASVDPESKAATTWGTIKSQQ